MIRSEIWEWEGSFFDGPFHRFLANGYLSRDGNKGSPGGFTLFMFCPKKVEASLNTNKSDIALLRDYFGLDVTQNRDGSTQAITMIFESNLRPHAL